MFNDFFDSLPRGRECLDHLQQISKAGRTKQSRYAGLTTRALAAERQRWTYRQSSGRKMLRKALGIELQLERFREHLPALKVDLYLVDGKLTETPTPEIGPVHGDLDALTRSDDGRHPEHKQFLDINSRIREKPIDLLDGMLAYTSSRQSEPVADGAHGQGCTGHHTNGGVGQRLNPLCMQAFAEQSIDKPVCILKLRRSHANNHWYLPRRATGRLLYCQPVFNPPRLLMPIFPINRRVPILFGKIFCPFDSFITQDPRK
jgi:hypothetical protein